MLRFCTSPIVAIVGSPEFQTLQVGTYLQTAIQQRNPYFSNYMGKPLLHRTERKKESVPVVRFQANIVPFLYSPLYQGRFLSVQWEDRILPL